MNKKNYMTDLNEIQNIAKQIRSINESIAFDEDDEMGMYGNEPDEEAEGNMNLSKMQQEPEAGKGGEMMPQEENPEDEGMRNLDQMGELDQIREITLKGMIKLCKNPEDPTYQALKKIFQMVDKGVEKEQKEQLQ